jgi:hypothetical protein
MRDYLGDRDRSTAPQWTFFAAVLAALATLAFIIVWTIAQLVGELARLI